MNDNEPVHETSLQTLIERYVSGDATVAEAQELEQHLLQDEHARNEYLDYVNLHASLRRWYLTANEERSLDGEWTDTPLLLSHEALENLGRRPRRSWLATVVIASCLLLALAIFQTPWFRQPDVSTQADLPRIVRVVGEVHVEATSGLATNAEVGDSVRVGETLRVEGDDEVVLRYGDGTKIELVGAATLVVGQSPQRGKHLELQRGTLQADVAAQPAEQPLLIITPHARVRVLGTRFELATDSEEGTRLDLESGRVELLRGVEKPLAVEPNSVAVVPSTPDPIRVTPRAAVIETPLREAAFPRLKSARFSADGSTIVAATPWQAVYWHEDDRLEATPFSPDEKKAVHFNHQCKHLLAIWQKETQTFALWDAVKREPVCTVDDYFGDEPPDRWHRATNVTALSPECEWVAVQRGRRFRLWDTAHQRWSEYADRYDNKPISAMVSSDDGRLLAIAMRRNTIDVIDPLDGQIVASWPIRHEVPMSLAFSANGQKLAAGFVGRLRVYDVATGDEVFMVHQPATLFRRVAISPDGRIVATTTQGKRIQMWDTESRAELPMLEFKEHVLDLDFAADSKRLVVVTKGRISVWEVGVEKPATGNLRSEAESK